MSERVGAYTTVCVIESLGRRGFGFVPATVTSTPYHGISLSGCELREWPIPSNRHQCHPRAVLGFGRLTGRALVRDGFHEDAPVVHDSLFQQAGRAVQTAGVHAGR